jgi:hypothetical protein
VARDAIIEAANAQMSLQCVYNSRLNEALNKKENKKETDRTKLFPDGKPRLLTGDVFMGEMVTSQKLREEKAAAMDQRKAGRADRKVAKATAGAAWKLQVEGHQMEVKRWEAECVVLKVQKVKVKDLPKKPKRPLKPKPVAEPDSESSSSDEE